ncbi:hypothetical protein EON67_07155, partial [archaeon]
MRRHARTANRTALPLVPYRRGCACTCTSTAAQRETAAMSLEEAAGKSVPPPPNLHISATSARFPSDFASPADTLPLPHSARVGAHSVSSSITLEALLDRLNQVADDHIRDGKAAKALLSGLARALKSPHKLEGVTVPRSRIVSRMCYYANARDTGIRSEALRVARYVVVDAPTAYS